jgi:hypothetical protein
MLDDEYMTKAEQVLGFRVVQTGDPHDYSTGLQTQWRVRVFDSKRKKEVWKVDRVMVASRREYDMFMLLTRPSAEWSKQG